MTTTPNDAAGERPREMPIMRLGAMLTDLDEVLRLQRRAAEFSSATAVERNLGAGHGGAALTTLLDAMLPDDPNAELRLARALQLDVEMLRQFRRRELGPAEMPADPLATLGRALALNSEAFDQLVMEDLRWFAEESPLAMLRDNTADPSEVRRVLRAAWERDALDAPDAGDAAHE
ncbi:hypothetical protein [Gemmatimonas sp.]|uniref:hypothetical protein n=1 Tax=Gemmatimonas sp. TaxID=1962908 RepID=UPI00286C236D|nr:hypothetical protein [Gemmatimonas sp.]